MSYEHGIKYNFLMSISNIMFVIIAIAAYFHVFVLVSILSYYIFSKFTLCFTDFIINVALEVMFFILSMILFIFLCIKIIENLIYYTNCIIDYLHNLFNKMISLN